MNNLISERIHQFYSGIIPHGYKLVEDQIIPNEWNVVKMSSIIEGLDSGVSVNSEDRACKASECGILKTSCVSDGRFYPNENKVIIERDYYRARQHPQKGMLIISRMNTPDLVGEIGYVDKDYNNLFIPDRLWQTRFSEEVNSKWLVTLMTTQKMKIKIKNIATGTSNSMKNISKDNFLSLEIAKPPLNEQEKLAEILSVWDKAIELKERLIEEKRKQKKGLMKKLLTGEVRVPGFEDEWLEVRLGDIWKERNESSHDHLELLAITGKNGIVRRSEVNLKDNSSNDKGKYKRICPMDIGYNTMRMWQGVSGVSMYEGIVSPAYTILKPRKSVDSQFFGYLFKLSKIIYTFWRNSQGLVDDTLNLKYANFKKIKVTIPPSLKEQHEIAKVLGVIDENINLMEKEMRFIKRQKQGLMQLLLTGLIRVKC